MNTLFWVKKLVELRFYKLFSLADYAKFTISMKPKYLLLNALLLPAIACSLLIGCQSADKPEAPPFKAASIDQNPSSAYLTPEESMKTMHLPAGYHLQLVASEPIVQEPVAVVWDANGDLYVAEMRSYMQDINGTGEHLPICRITKLQDTDWDGKMDKSTIFIDSLVLPRMMLMVDDKLIVNETYSYNMYAYRDTNNDGVADEKKLVYHNDEEDNANLEHQKSGLVWNVDNNIYVTSNPVRYRYENGMLQPDSLADSPGGQWGLTNDDFGRLFFSSAGGETPALHFQQNPEYGELNLDSQRVNNFDIVWPIIATPDVQGGKGRLNPDSTLNHFTASCGQSVFRGDRLPKNMNGDLFICEPVGRLIRRAKVMDKNGMMVLKNAYDSAEFLVSKDMNFRPVNTATGPDGCLYIVDMYHGIIQESNWTKEDSYLRPQILKKQLDKNINRGRIYRIVHNDFKRGPRPQLLKATTAELVDDLKNPNGWWRDNAQKLLVIKGDQSVVPSLKSLALNEKSFFQNLAFWQSEMPTVSRVQALWTLDGLHAVDKQTLFAALKDEAPEMRTAAVRISESFLKQNDADVLQNVLLLGTDTSWDVRVQLALSLRFSNNAKSKDALKQLAAIDPQNKMLKYAVNKSLEATDEALNALKASVKNMPGDEQDLIIKGSINFKQLCATCHGAEGKGLPTQVAPPLVASARVNGSSDVLIRILLNGLKGPVDNHNYPDVMPAQKANNNEYIASVLSYIRNSIGNKASVIKPEDVEKIRKETGDRPTAWTLEELAKLKK